ncbi:tRNA (guanine-N(7)-)-methyltransferase (tRNA(m7G46)-methyltransferase) [Coemansia sp. RSA 1200]|nr:tRNA (guanine-N(7)-)-methyltransferase (tRNA(m7G46)-methyltransferase) [Coemansia sp. RSA 1200]
MSIAILANVRALVWYTGLLAVLVGVGLGVLLAANISASYWFQRRREQQQLGPALDGERKSSGYRLPLDPPVRRIPRLAFAAEVTAATQTSSSSLCPTAYNTDGWTAPSIGQLAESGYPQVQHEMEQLASLVVRDFVHRWFADVTADTSFPRCVHAQVVQAVDAVAERIAGSRVDPAELVVAQVLPLATAHIHAVRSASANAAVATAAAAGEGDNSEQSRVAQAYASQPGIRWHPALAALLLPGKEDDSGQATADQRKRAVAGHVRRVVDLVVPLILPPEQTGLSAHRVLVREILAGAVLAPAVASIADPDTINQLLGAQLERMIREQHMVSELRDALDKQAAESVEANSSGSSKAARLSQQPILRAIERNDDEDILAPAGVVSYEEFMQSIDRCSDTAQVARIRDDILAQIRKRRILIMGHGKGDVVHGQRVRDVLVYINRLYVAKKKAERRLDVLMSGQGASQQQLQQQQTRQNPLLQHRPLTSAEKAISRASTYYDQRDDPRNLGPPQFTLREILTNVSSLSAFAEYMDLIGSQLALEFWVNVEGAKQTARAACPGDKDDSARQLLPSIVGSLWKSYFTVRVDELAALGSDIETAIGRVQRCLKPHRRPASMDLDSALLTPPLCCEAFELVALVQDAVFRHMQTGVFPSFLRSNIYSRFLTEYYVTPRHDQISASLFASSQPEPTASLQPQPQPVADSRSWSARSDAGSSRRRSLVRSVAGTLGRGRSASNSSASTAPASLGQASQRTFGAASIFRRARPEAPLVGTDTSQALAGRSSAAEPAGRSRSAAQLAALAATSPPTLAPAPELAGFPAESLSPDAKTAPPLVPQLSRRPTRVGRSEVRRLSASLRSIGLGDAAAADKAMSAEVGFGSPIAESVIDEESDGAGMLMAMERSEDASGAVDGGKSELPPPEPLGADNNPNEEDDDNDDNGDGDEELSADEAETLVLARVIRTPTPGDLFLNERIERLARDLERKTHQMAIVRALMRQAESRHKPHEQRVLAASFRGLRREVQAGAEQQRLYETVLGDHILSPQRTRIRIPRAVNSAAGDSADSAFAGTEAASGTSEQKTHVVYLLELQQSMPPEHLDPTATAEAAAAAAASPALVSSANHAPTGWVVSRRYREFYQMHKELRTTWPNEMRAHELPARTPLIRLQRDRDIEHRRLGLEKYLQGLLSDPRVANARAVRLFLSSTLPPPLVQGPPSILQSASAAETGESADVSLSLSAAAAAADEGDYDADMVPSLRSAAAVSGWMAQIYKTVGEDIEGITGADSMLEIIVQELGAKVAMQQQQQLQQQQHTQSLDTSGALGISSKAAPISGGYDVLAAGALPPLVDTSSAGFIDPLSDLFVEVFGLKNRRNWLRRQAISILLRHIVGGTVERRVRDMVGTTVRDMQLAALVSQLRNILWPPDPKTHAPGLFRAPEPRIDSQKADSLRDARSRILWLLPRILGGMVGKKNARDGARLLVDVAQHPLPNLNLALHVFDVLVVSAFPEIKFQLEANHPPTAP